MRLRTWLSDTIHKKALFIALVHWYVTFFFEKDLFIRSTLESKTFTVAKIIVIFSFWQIAAYMFRRYKREADYRRFIHFSAIYFLFSMVVLLMIWPGNWGWEKMGLIGVVRNFEQYAWHHYLMIWFYYYATLLLPSPVSVIILQLACLSLIVGYFVYSISETIHRSKLAWLAYIPFIFPSVLAQNYFPLRATLFAYIVLLLLVILIKSISRQKTLPPSCSLRYPYSLPLSPPFAVKVSTFWLPFQFCLLSFFGKPQPGSKKHFSRYLQPFSS
ncbi:hypothetical protein [Saezia sanguinis]|uniref:hypothetical protein n=1 Tax=Saezia sanguinis TaxID=1965230 RepID=UPI000F8EDA6E|nr:hypothetical protein [Saezia sanguinis]